MRRLSPTAPTTTRPVLSPIRMRKSTPRACWSSARARQGMLHVERRVGRALGMIFMRDRRTKQRHKAIAEKLVHRTLIPMDPGEHELEGAVDERVHLLRVETLGKRGEARHICEQDRHLLSLAFERALGDQNLLGEVSGGVGLGRREAGLRASAGGDLVGALRTELRGRRELRATVCAGAGQWSRAFLAELR